MTTVQQLYELSIESYIEGYNIEMTKKIKDNNIYFHFASSTYCNKFIKQNNLYGCIRSYCCNNKGFSIRNTHVNIEQIKINADEFNKIHIQHVTFKKTSDVDCCVCYESCDNLTLCGHVLCINCLCSLPKNNCPYCNQPLVTSDP